MKCSCGHDKSDHIDGIGRCTECDMEGAFGMNSNCTHFNQNNSNKLIDVDDIKKFKMSDLAGKVIKIELFESKNKKLLIAKDINTGDIFIIDEM